MATQVPTTPSPANESACSEEILRTFGVVLDRLEAFITAEVALEQFPDALAEEAKEDLRIAEAAQDALSEALTHLSRFESNEDSAVPLLFFGEQLRFLLGEEDRSQVGRIHRELEAIFANRSAIAQESALRLATARRLLGQLTTLALYAPEGETGQG